MSEYTQHEIEECIRKNAGECYRIAGRYYDQIDAMKSRHDADSAAKHIRKMGYLARVVPFRFEGDWRTSPTSYFVMVAHSAAQLDVMRASSRKKTTKRKSR